MCRLAAHPYIALTTAIVLFAKNGLSLKSRWSFATSAGSTFAALRFPRTGLTTRVRRSSYCATVFSFFVLTMSAR